MRNDSLSWVRDIGSCSEPAELETDIEEFIQDLITEYDIEDVELSDIEVKVSSRLSRAHGNARITENGTHLLKFSWNAYKRFGWDEVKETVRHELAHAIDCARRGRSDEGPVFQKIAERLDAPLSADAPAGKPKYLISCVDCSMETPRFVRSKTVQEPERYNCGRCGGDVEVIEL